MSACDCGHGELRPVDEAIAALLELAPSPPAAEWVPLAEALGRTLAEPVHALRPMPAWDNSAMDGYALRAADLPEQGGCLPLAGRIAAGDSVQALLPEGHAVRIFTGAPLPRGADSVVPQEQARVEGDRVWLPPCKAGDHVRRCGEECERGERILESGKLLRAQELGLLASLGVPEVAARRRLRVGLLSSGNELREPGEILLPGQIYNANRYSLGGVLRGLGLEVDDCGVLIDDLATSRDALSLAASEWDVLITSGGVSVGEEDHLKQAVRELGELHLWRLAIQPGKPFAFGQVCGTPWIGLPGNPVAALITALVVARPFLLRAQGRRDVLPRAVPVAAGFSWPKANPRRQYLRARLQQGGSGLQVMPYEKQGSAMLTSACWADGLALVESGGTLAVGEPVDFLPFSELFG
ncbi:MULTISPECIES: gephyrin-like molybdotransferase Glp [unclassified Pseudomonas]|uniref:molybdopterin molybdotransferase MoeA n=1 Tax=unclassified Pseudomonas TaxID=196821 RepID=UPI00244A8F29|nr:MULTISPECIES: gephyrin-like molybdotransferase Glp [unclassified Pseudomonas]MDG9922983.1 molybdopterin molybdotransferase MoeA [Pseudomonas sp. GD04045]MDH0035653.1 molybdopterin molybdotransferase MoeA [Pseudomonas sp. GD04019]